MLPKLWNRQVYDDLTKDSIFGKDNCPFCDPDAQKELIIWEWRYWFILYNLYPYSGDHGHVMAVPYAHKQYSHELDEDEFSELLGVHAFLKSFYGNGDYFSCTRETMANRSIEHVHMHFLPGKLQWNFVRKMLELQGFPIVQDLQIP